MINRREWIERVIAATAATLIDTSGLLVMNYCEECSGIKGGNCDCDCSSVSVASCGGGEGWAAKRRFADYYGIALPDQDCMSAHEWWVFYRAIPASVGFDPFFRGHS